ncbi:GNAT family N-acetyltransferase [Pseudoduganella rivuli]|nr:GNAT family N-acetyltransferase [Pseudoduganella rivuli]
MPTRDTIDVQFHANQTVTIAGVTLAPLDAYPILEQAAQRTPPPLLNFITDEGAGYESVGRIIYQAVRAGFPDESFSFHDPSSKPVLRPATEADIPFLLDLRHQTMDATMIAAGKTPSDEAHMQRVLYAFESAHIVLLADQPVGLLKVVRDAPVWDLVQIQVAPSAQGKGLGERLLRGLIAQAMASDVSVKLSVFKVNPALRLYTRLGFTVTDETEDAYEMVFMNPR